MRTTLATLTLSGILISCCYAQESGTPVASNATLSPTATPGTPKADQAAYYATLNRRVIEANTQFELLNQLAQEHRKRTEATPRDQGSYQWESELTKELSDQASAILSLLNNVSKERLAVEQAHPDLAASVLPNSATGATNGPNPDEIAFLAKLAEKRTAVQQEIAATTAAASLYYTQLATNSSSGEPSQVYSLIRDNDNSAKRLQKELSDLELKHLEFRALRKP